MTSFHFHHYYRQN